MLSNIFSKTFPIKRNLNLGLLQNLMMENGFMKNEKFEEDGNNAA